MRESGSFEPEGLKRFVGYASLAPDFSGRDRQHLEKEFLRVSSNLAHNDQGFFYCTIKKLKFGRG